MPITDRVLSDQISDEQIADHLRIALALAQAKNYEVLLYLCSMALEELNDSSNISTSEERAALHH